MKQEIKDILETIENHGYQAYLVGGYVRDHLLGIENEDIDIATDATPEQMKEMFKQERLSGETRFGNVNIGGIQVTTFRKDVYSEGSRFPEVIYTSSLEEDALRRDFTMNALYMDKNEQIIDVVHGLDDLFKGIIRTVKDPMISMKEDPLRMVRALRFQKKLKFTVDEDLIQAISYHKHLIHHISKKRLYREVEKENDFTLKDIEWLLKK